MFKKIIPLVFLLNCSFFYHETAHNKKIKIHKDFPIECRSAIIEAINKWNEVGQKYVGYDLIFYDGVDERDFDVNSGMTDDTNTIYYLNTTGYEDGKYLAYVVSAGTDIIFFKDRLQRMYKKQGFYDESYEYLIKVSAFHELGHFIGIGPVHINQMDDSIVRTVKDDETNVMSSYIRPAFELSEDDVRLFCQVYNCEQSK